MLSDTFVHLSQNFTMFKTYLLEVIKAMPPIKPRELNWVLDSPMFNKGGNAKEMAKLYNVIMETAPQFPEEALQKDSIYFKVFADKSEVPRKLDKLMSDLNKTLRLYLLTKTYLAEKNDAQQQLDWAAWLRENGIEEKSKQTLTKLKASFNESNAESLDFFRVNFQIAMEEHERESKYNIGKGDLAIPNLIDSLDLFFYNYRISILNRYSLQGKATTLQGLLNKDAGIDNYLQKSILLKISNKIAEILEKPLPDITEVLDLIETLNASEEKISFESLVECYAFLRSICTLVINAGHLDFIPILHKLHLNNIKNGVLLNAGKISSGLYLNLVVIATRAKDFDWAKKITEEYKTLIPGGDENHVLYHLNKAQCFFAEGHYEKALDCLPQTSSNTYYHSLVRLLELKIYYEQKSLLLQYKIDAFRKYIERTAPKTLPVDYQTLILNFLNILLQLSQTPFKNKARSEVLIKRIAEKKLISERAWLIEKAKELG